MSVRVGRLARQRGMVVCLSFVAVVTSQGAATNEAGVVRVGLGELGVTSNALVTLRNPKASAHDRSVSLCAALHLFGDLHQPLHTANLVTKDKPKGNGLGSSFLVREERGEIDVEQYLDAKVDGAVAHLDGRIVGAGDLPAHVHVDGGVGGEVRPAASPAPRPGMPTRRQAAATCPANSGCWVATACGPSCATTRAPICGATCPSSSSTSCSPACWRPWACGTRRPSRDA